MLFNFHTVYYEAGFHHYFLTRLTWLEVKTLVVQELLTKEQEKQVSMLIWIISGKFAMCLGVLILITVIIDVFLSSQTIFASMLYQKTFNPLLCYLCHGLYMVEVLLPKSILMVDQGWFVSGLRCAAPLLHFDFTFRSASPSPQKYGLVQSLAWFSQSSIRRMLLLKNLMQPQVLLCAKFKKA